MLRVNKRVLTRQSGDVVRKAISVALGLLAQPIPVAVLRLQLCGATVPLSQDLPGRYRTVGQNVVALSRAIPVADTLAVTNHVANAVIFLAVVVM